MTAGSHTWFDISVNNLLVPARPLTFDASLFHEKASLGQLQEHVPKEWLRNDGVRFWDIVLLDDPKISMCAILNIQRDRHKFYIFSPGSNFDKVVWRKERAFVLNVVLNRLASLRVRMIAVPDS